MTPGVGPVLVLCLALTSCPGGGEDFTERTAADRTAGLDLRLGLSQNAHPEIFKAMLAEIATPRHPSDGGGRAWIESVENAAGEPVELRAGDRARFRLVYEAGPLGIARGGTLLFQISPFWEWDPPQPVEPDEPGYTLPTYIEGAKLLGNGTHLKVMFEERPLAPGERVRFVYGAGSALARVDRFAERDARLWFAVDGDGDGYHAFLDDLPTVDIAAGAPARLVVVLPTTARPGDAVTLRVSVLDRDGSSGTDFQGEVSLEASGGLDLPGAISFAAEHRGQRQIVARVDAPGVFRVTATAASDGTREVLTATSNPIAVGAQLPRLLWADLHGHSQFSDGTGTPEDYFRYARDIAGLDVIALTDHDHWGLRFLDTDPTLWARIRAAVASFHVPGQFVTLLGYEWTSTLHGHRHVLYFEDEGKVLSAFDPRYETPTQLWDALRGEPALTFAHHSAGGPISTNWNYRPDPEIEPLTEIASIHGSSEAPDSSFPIYNPVEGNYVRDALDAGLRFGFIGSGDSHDGHPGLAHLNSPLGGGLAAIWSEDLTREGIRSAMRARRVYATNGPRIYLEVSIDDAAMGSTIEAIPDVEGDPSEGILRLRTIATSPLERVDLIRPGAIESIPLDGELEWSLERPIRRLGPGEYLYARVVQRDGGTAWSSPIYARE